MQDKEALIKKAQDIVTILNGLYFTEVNKVFEIADSILKNYNYKVCEPPIIKSMPRKVTVRQ